MFGGAFKTGMDYFRDNYRYTFTDVDENDVIETLIIDPAKEYLGKYCNENVVKSLAKYFFIEVTECKYLFASDIGRKKFIKKLNDLIVDIQGTTIKKYKDSKNNKLYKQTMIEYIKGAKYLNEILINLEKTF